MSRRRAPLLCLLLAAGCAGSPPPGPLPEAAECERLAGLAARGDHQQAADALAALRRSGLGCPAEVEAAGEESSRRLVEADELIREAQDRRRAGDLDTAAERLAAALEIYPRYEWAAKLLRDVEAARSLETGHAATIARQLEMARAAEDRQELDLAAGLTLEAMATGPAGPDQRAELVDYAERLGVALFSEGALHRAKELWEGALALAGDSERLTGYLEELQRRLDSLDKLRHPD